MDDNETQTVVNERREESFLSWITTQEKIEKLRLSIVILFRICRGFDSIKVKLKNYYEGADTTILISIRNDYQEY